MVVVPWDLLNAYYCTTIVGMVLHRPEVGVMRPASSVSIEKFMR